MVPLLIAGVGLYIYGYLQKDFALAKQEEALKVQLELKECQVEVARQKEIAMQADMEASHQKQVASDYFIKMDGSKKQEKVIMEDKLFFERIRVTTGLLNPLKQVQAVQKK